MFEKIISIYPELTVADFNPSTGTIALQDNSDGNGAFIAKWEHPTLPRPTQSDLDAITE